MHFDPVFDVVLLSQLDHSFLLLNHFALIVESNTRLLKWFLVRFQVALGILVRGVFPILSFDSVAHDHLQKLLPRLLFEKVLKFLVKFFSVLFSFQSNLFWLHRHWLRDCLFDLDLSDFLDALLDQ